MIGFMSTVGYELKHNRFHLTTRKNIFPVWVTEHGHRLPREVEESPLLEIFRSCPDSPG